MYTVRMDLNGKSCIVIGAGKTAQRRIKELIKEKAVITVVADEPMPAGFKNKAIKYYQKSYEKSDLKNQFIAFASTDNPVLNQQIVFDAHNAGILVSSVTKCLEMKPDLLIPSVCECGKISASVDTNGISPALSAEIRRETEHYLTRYDGICEIHSRIRNQLLRKYEEPEKRYSIMRMISSEAMCILYRTGRKEEYIKQTEKILNDKIVRISNKRAVVIGSCTIKNIREIRKYMPESDIYFKFSGEKIINSIDSDTVSGILTQLSLMGYKEVYFQPDYISAGEAYDNFCNEVNAYSKVFSVLRIGKPLLSKVSDFLYFIEALRKEFTSDSETAFILIGYETSHFADMIYTALQYQIDKTGLYNIIIGTAQGFPSIDDVTERLEKSRYKKIILQSLIISADDYSHNDTAVRTEILWKSIFINNGYSVKIKIKGLQEYNDIQKIYLRHLREIFIIKR